MVAPTIKEMIKALIFDLGRVLVNVDYDMGHSRMAALSGLRAEERSPFPAESSGLRAWFDEFRENSPGNA